MLIKSGNHYEWLLDSDKNISGHFRLQDNFWFVDHNQFVLNNDHIGFVSNYRIYEPHQNKGYGQQMMKELIQEARRLKMIKIVLDVLRDNERAVRVYYKSGFSIDAHQPSINKWWMTLSLS